MGQSKSKIGALEEQNGDTNLVGVKAKKSSRQRKWRKKKGYSLSVSLEGDLNCDVDSGSLAGRSAKDGPVLVSYNVWKGENEALGRRNSYQHGSSSGSEFAIREDGRAGTINCMNIHQPLLHPPVGQDHSDKTSEQGETCHDSGKNHLVQSILTKNTLNSNVSILKEDPPSPKTKTRIDNKSSPRPTQPEESSVSSVSSSQGKKHFKINILYLLLAAPYPGYDYELDFHLTD